MTSFQADPRRRNGVLSDGGGTRFLPTERRRLWVELPGWVTAYIRERTTIRKNDTTNSHVFEVLCKLWNVPKGFGLKKNRDHHHHNLRHEDEDGDDEGEEEEGHRPIVVYAISESVQSKRVEGTTTTNSSRRSIENELPSSVNYSHNLVREMVEIIEFLAENLSARTKRLGWKMNNNHNSLESLLRTTAISHEDWIVFPVPDLILWSSTDSSSWSSSSSSSSSTWDNSTQKLLRHLNLHPSSDPSLHPPPPSPRIAVFGNPNYASYEHQKQLSARSMQLAEIWNHGFFLTMTSKAAASNLEGLRRLMLKLVGRQYEGLGEEEEEEEEDPSKRRYDLVMWLSLKTYWLLSPDSMNDHPRQDQNDGSDRDPRRQALRERPSTADRIRSLRAYNLLHDADLDDPIPILTKDRLEQAIRTIMMTTTATATTTMNSFNFQTDHPDRRNPPSSIHLRTERVLDPLKIQLSPIDAAGEIGVVNGRPLSSELSTYLAAMNQVHHHRRIAADPRHHHHEDEDEELKIIHELGARLIQTFWKFRLTLVVVSDRELERIAGSSRFEASASCQFIRFDTLLRLIDHKFSMAHHTP